MRIALISHSSVIDVYQDKIRHLSQMPDCDMHLIIPAAYRENSRLIEGYTGTGEYKVFAVPTYFGTSGRQNLHFYRTLLPILRHIQPDIVHIEEEPESLVTSQSIFLAKKLSPAPKIVLFTWRNQLKTHEEWNLIQPQRYLYPLNEAYTLKNINAMISGTEDGVRIFRDLGCTFPMTIIPQYGVNPDIYKPMDTTSLRERAGLTGTVIGFVGRLLKMKGIETLLRAFATIHLHHPNTQLLLLGSGPDRKYFEDIASSLRIQKYISIIESVPAAEVASYLNCMDMMVLPSLTTPEWREQFGRVLIEAMACDVPVIGSSSGEIPHVIGEAGLIFQEGNVDELASRLKQYLDTPALRMHYVQAGRQHVLEHYTNQQIAQKIYEVYQMVIGQ